MSRLLAIKGDKSAGDNLLATLAANQGALLSLVGLFETALKKNPRSATPLHMRLCSMSRKKVRGVWLWGAF